MTHKQKVLLLLSDRKPHSHHELYQLGCVAHSRISDLRKDGYVIEQWRDGDLYLYRLAGVLDEAASENPSRFDHGRPHNPVPPGATVAASSSTPTSNRRLVADDKAYADGSTPTPPDGAGVLVLFDSTVGRRFSGDRA